MERGLERAGHVHFVGSREESHCMRKWRGKALENLSQVGGNLEGNAGQRWEFQRKERSDDLIKSFRVWLLRRETFAAGGRTSWI